MSDLRLVVTEEAKRNIASIFDWIAERSPDGANRWRKALWHAIASLKNCSSLYPLAFENNEFEETIQQLTFQLKSGRAYRVIYTVTDDAIVVLFVRGPGQDWIKRGQ